MVRPRENRQAALLARRLILPFRRWAKLWTAALLLGGAFALLLVIIFVLPERLVPPAPTPSDVVSPTGQTTTTSTTSQALSRVELLKARNDVRTSLLAAFGGAVA